MDWFTSNLSTHLDEKLNLDVDPVQVQRQKDDGQMLLDGFYEKRFPKPGSYVQNSVEYLQEIVEDDDEDEQKRLAAAHDLGMLDWLANSGETQKVFRWGIVLDEVVDTYRRQLVQRDN